MFGIDYDTPKRFKAKYAKNPYGPDQVARVAQMAKTYPKSLPAYYTKSFPDMLQAHKKIAELRLRGYSPEDIAGIMNSTGGDERISKETVLTVLGAPCIVDWLAAQRAKIKEYREAYDDSKRKAAEEGFDVLAGMVTGKIKAEKVRLDAAIKAMEIDPDRRFEPSKGGKDERSPYTGDALLEFMEAVKAIEVHYEVVEPEPNQEKAECLEK